MLVVSHTPRKKKSIKKKEIWKCVLDDNLTVTVESCYSDSDSDLPDSDFE